MRLPSATYRLQLRADFTLDAARELVPYLDSLGITDLYLSPVLESRAGSLHGYDVTDPTRVRDELGGEAALARLAAEAHGRGMGVLLDIVPNHMAASVENPWWVDVLTSGPASQYAAAFDIDWEPARAGLAGKVLLPVLTTHYGEALERGDLRVELGGEGLGITYDGLRLPLSPRSQATVLGSDIARLERAAGPADPGVLELAAIVDALASGGPRPGDDSRAAVARLLRLVERDERIREHVESRLRRWNGAPGDPRSFDLLDRLLEAQSYRVAYWPVADQEINYRRFFDVNDLVALRVEDDRVFTDYLGTVVRLVRSGLVDGLRIDHVDGLHDPARFLARLREAVGGDTYIVAEKILAPDEELRAWPVQGSTGYESLSAVNDLFIDPEGLGPPVAAEPPDGGGRAFRDEVYAAKRHVITELFGGELRNLAQRLGRLAEQHRHGRDLTLTELGRALVGVTACLGVYRTYIDSFKVEAADREAVEAAVAEAIRRDPDNARATLFMRHVLLLDLPARSGPAQRALWVRFVMRWQQLASAAMAKGQEDTAFYRHVGLLSRNEVGADPARPPAGPAEFHERMAGRARRWPHPLSASATHDTKRGEDVRARIDVLSELAEEAAERSRSWRRWCEERVGPAARALGPDTERLLFQTIVGAWPPLPDASFGDRVAAFAVKAAREAKRETNWRSPSEAYEAALVAFARAVVDADESDGERRALAAFAERVALLGVRVSLAQRLLNATMPGVPDLYQGTELWDLSLVDPDNRRPVDFEHRRDALAKLDAAAAEGRARELLEGWRDGRVKLHVTATALRVRRAHRRVFEEGRYVPVAVAGDAAERIVAFARSHEGDWAVTVVPRLAARIEEWGDTVVVLPADAP
ncbi:MAG: malto-oligosyltrehalose synthase, partial [Candidatus Limnocylindria bacterium]